MVADKVVKTFENEEEEFCCKVRKYTPFLKNHFYEPICKILTAVAQKIPRNSGRDLYQKTHFLRRNIQGKTHYGRRCCCGGARNKIAIE